MSDAFIPLSTAVNGVVGNLAAQIAIPVEHPDGVYFGLSEHAYRADPALGSTDKKDLLGNPARFWWNSAMNPAREERDDTPAQIIGTATHCFVLYGAEEFSRRYGRCSSPGNITAGKAERAEHRAEGRLPLAGKDFDRIRVAATMIRANPELREVLGGGQTEVSVFYTTMVDGEPVREKARLDILKTRAVADLKSHAPMDGLSFPASCCRAVRTYRYHQQAAAYLQARARLAEFVAMGAVYGDHDGEWLRKVAAANEYAFVLVFWASVGAPETWGGVFSPSNPKIAEGEMAIERALRRYVEFRREFGAGAAWIKPEPLAEIDPIDVDEWWRRDAA